MICKKHGSSVTGCSRGGIDAEMPQTSLLSSVDVHGTPIVVDNDPQVVVR